MTLPPLTPEEHTAANLGARMASEGFNEDDNPYPVTDPKHAQWWRAWQWCHRLVGSAVRS